MEPKRVLVVLFEGFNTMDMNGPYEVFRMADNRNAFTVTITAEMEVTRSFEGVQVKVIPASKWLIPRPSLADYSS